MTETGSETKMDRSNRKVAVVCSAGYGGTTQRVDQYSDVILDRTIKVRFDANTAAGMPWEFKPKQREIEIRIGETAEAIYLATNLANHANAGTASFNVSPALAGAYFNKLECFCFTEQVLQPGESYEMPVQFFVDPEIINVPEMKDIQTITLSYTFHPLTKETAEVQAEAAKKRIGG